ncbi:MAG TPA: GNAT family N-acetyltransferase [Fimbriimonas sp.]|nr:GNAT family N-acetyltransferase [Fimbriimonas sp.]
MEVRYAEPQEVAPLRELFRLAANCQIVKWAHLSRGFAYPVMIEAAGQQLGYGVVQTTEPEEMLIEWFSPDPDDSQKVFDAILEFTTVPLVTYQTNFPFVESVLNDHIISKEPGPILFEVGTRTEKSIPDAEFRRKRVDDKIFAHTTEPEGEWVIEWRGEVVATGGYFTHYNPPFADLYMEVAPKFRRMGFGSLMVHELVTVIEGTGFTPSARCNPNNLASAECLQSAGMTVCGQLITARIH